MIKQIIKSDIYLKSYIKMHCQYYVLQINITPSTKKSNRVKPFTTSIYSYKNRQIAIK